MPPVTTPSRTGPLITWTVVTSILFVTATIFAIYYYVAATKADDIATKLTQQYKEIATPTQIGGEEVSQLKAKRGDAEGGYTNSMTVLDVATKERDDLAKLINGTPGETVLKTGQSALDAANAKAKEAGVADLPRDLRGAITTLTQALTSRQGEIASLNDQLKSAQDKAMQSTKELAANQEALNKALADARSQAEQASSSLTSDRATKDEQLKKMIADSETSQAAAQEQLTQAQTSMSDLNKKLEIAYRQIEELRDRLGQNRANTSQAAVRQADGKVIRVPGNGTAYIDLGAGDQITAGMTFEVYDRIEGIPAAGDVNTEETLPKGKGSIEVVRVGAGSSECRIVYQQPGHKINDGDIIANLIYDRNVRSRFFVYGDFDLDQNGVATAKDAELIKQLVVQWGGKVQDHIGTDTDFIILGKEPIVIIPTKEEANEPIIQAKAQASQAAADAYSDVKQRAIEYHIPILNQNRFLYFIGYFEMAKR